MTKQRFKGMENFLRKVAFNLGNTPSQTEVKIISCIPIDVTDLQKKIIELEKQLEERTQRVCVSAVHTAIVNPSCTSKHSKAGNSSYLLLNPTCSTKQKDSINSLICFEEANPSDAYRYTSFSEITPTECCMPTKHRRKFLFNKKKVKRNKNLNTHIVYYMQPEGKTPFNNYSLTDYETFKNRRKNVNIFNRSYLSELVSKQYNHGELNKGRTVSEFSTPICRDFIPIQKGHEPQAYDTDICSCCRGRFQNIDNHISKQNHFGILLSDSTRVNTRNAYYDTNFYDVVPVKENSIKVKNLNVSKRKDSKTHVDISCWPENVHLRYRAPPTLAPLRQHITRKVPLISHIKKEKTLNNMAKKKPILCDPGSPKNNIQVLNTHSVEYSEVYAKRLKNSRVRISKLTPTKVNKFKDAACSNIVVVNTERQTTSDSNADSQDNKKNVALSPSFSEDKTDVTLNQIKSILQSVLTVVKTQTKISKISEQVKKDAVVQETPTNNFCYPNILPESVKGGMQLYPLFIQQQRNMYDSCYGNNNIKLTNMKSAVSAATNTEELQVRSQETEHLIKEIYKSMALNIESIERMAGCKYMVPTKDTSVKEHGDINETIQNYNNSPEDTETKHIAKALSEIFQTTNSLCTSVTLNNDTPLKSNLGSNKKSFRSQPVRNCRQSSRKERVDCYSNHVYSEGGDNDETEQGSELESNDDRDDTIVDDKTGPPISETESDEVIPFKKKEKIIIKIFSKILNLFKTISRNRKKDVKNEQSSDIDSDHYQTVYRHKVAASMPTHKTIKTKQRTKQTIRPRKKRPKEDHSSDSDSDHSYKVYSHKNNRIIKSEARSKVNVTCYHQRHKKPQRNLRNQYPDNTARFPYMEQEYRKYFDEKLKFNDNRHWKYPSRDTTPRRRAIY